MYSYNYKLMDLRTQFDDRLPVEVVHFPDSVVQSGMSPSISQMVRTRSVGGQIDEFEMDGIETDAPLDSEYYDFFDLADMAQDLESSSPVERQTGNPSADDPAPPQESPSDDSPPKE